MSKPRLFDKIPQQAPDTPWLDRVDLPADLRALDEADLQAVADDLREYLLYSVGQSGGHFGAGLGVVELTVALHYVLNTPEDHLVWDVGHQSYPHKILTGRKQQMNSMRKLGGLSGFPKRSESPYDTFGVGHSSTSISAALGMALADAKTHPDRHTIAVIGDGAMTAGMAFEALNHAAHTDANLLVVLNDNQMSISPNKGGLATYFAKIWASKTYIQLRENSKKMLSKIPPAWDFAKRTEGTMKSMVAPGAIFEELGFNYIGPMDGHDLATLVPTLRNMLSIKGPRLLHITTVKGKGFLPAEEDPVGYHAINKIEAAPSTPQAVKPSNGKKYQDVFGDWLCDIAAKDERAIGITPAMCEGSGMVRFAKEYPERYHDVAIAEQHAVTFAAGLATQEKKPVVAIYSTFLQRAYDQLIHDVALQNLDVTFGIDRAGLVGEDGPSHAGSFDLSFLRCIPNMIIMAPSDEHETRLLLQTGYEYDGPAAVRYPRGKGTGAATNTPLHSVPIGQGIIKRKGHSVAILNFGVLLPAALKAAEAIGASVADMRFVKPLDTELIDKLISSHEMIVTIEENSVGGGAGSAVAEYLNSTGALIPVLQLGLPDRYVEHGQRDYLLKQCGLDSAGIKKQIEKRMALLFKEKAQQL